jgi:hypothetical protein
MRYTFVIAAILLTAAACDKGQITTSPTAPSTSASTVNVVIKDSPFTDAQAVLVTFAPVDAEVSAADFVPLPLVAATATRTCDLKQIGKTPDVLATGALTAGHYIGLRLIVTSAVIYFDNPASGEPCASIISTPAGRSAAVAIPSGDVRISEPFDVSTISATTITLDFNGDASITQNAGGAYIMNPVITVDSVK